MNSRAGVSGYNPRHIRGTSPKVRGTSPKVARSATMTKTTTILRGPAGFGAGKSQSQYQNQFLNTKALYSSFSPSSLIAAAGAQGPSSTSPYAGLAHAAAASDGNGPTGGLKGVVNGKLKSMMKTATDTRPVSKKRVVNPGMTILSRQQPNKSVTPLNPKSHSKVNPSNLTNEVHAAGAKSTTAAHDTNGNVNPTFTSVMGELTSDPLKWFRDEQETNEISRSLSRNPVKYHIGPYQQQGILETGDDERLITVGGYIISMERGHGLHTVIRPRISSKTTGLEIEIRIADVDPEAIRLDRRYNAILVIGVKESALKRKDVETLKANLKELDPNFQMEDDLIEVVNIFVPRDVSLSRVLVTQPDTKGRVFIRAP